MFTATFNDHIITSLFYGTKNLQFLTFFTDFDECVVLDPCQNNGTCYNTNGSYVCQCTDGWHGHDCEQGIGTFYT